MTPKTYGTFILGTIFVVLVAAMAVQILPNVIDGAASCHVCSIAALTCGVVVMVIFLLPWARQHKSQSDD